MDGSRGRDQAISSLIEVEGGIKLSPRKGKKILKEIFDAAPACKL
jgi:hypothetical protein